MIDKILKIAKVKDVKAFYKKFPTEEAFMKVHGKEFKKAQTGTSVANASSNANFAPLDFNQYYSQADKSITGSTDAERQQQAYQQAMLQATQQGSSNSGGGFDLSKIASSIGDIAKVAGSMSSGKRGINIPKARPGTEVNFGSAMNTQWNPNGTSPPTYAGYDQEILNRHKFHPGTGDTTNEVASEGQDTNPFRYKPPQLTGDPSYGASANINPQLQTAGQYIDKPTTAKVNWAQGLPVVEKVVGLVQKLQAEKEAVRGARQDEKVSGLAAKATEQVDVDSQRQLAENMTKKREALMPVNTGEEFFPIYGVGTNPLARNGYMLQGGGEIQNTYAPNTLYDDLGFEPLNDSDIIKQYRMGGNLRQAQWGEIMSAVSKGKIGSTSQFAGGAGGAVGQFANAGGTDAVGNVATQISGGDSAGADIGGEVGGAIGSIWGPVGQMVGKVVGTVGGNLIDTNPEKIKKAQAATTKNIERTAGMNFGKGIQAQYNSYVRDGGTIDYNPQLINYFGDHTAQDVYDYAHEGMDSLRTGGNIRQNLFTQQSMAMGGELQTHWGGHAQPIAYNPYLPDGGETVMFRGNSHQERSSNGETGIGVTYGDNPVEVERGEPAVKLQDGGNENSLVVFGNLKFDKKQAMATGDKELIEIANEYGGKKFKRIEHQIANKTNRENKKIAKATDELNELNPITSFDKLKLTSLKATIDGGNMKLKKYAADTENLANFQNAINATADEHGFIADNLARGEVKIDKNAFSNSAEFGTSIPKAQTGNNVKEVTVPKDLQSFGSMDEYKKDLEEKKQLKLQNLAIRSIWLQEKIEGKTTLSFDEWVKINNISPESIKSNTPERISDNTTKREKAIKNTETYKPSDQSSGLYIGKLGYEDYASMIKRKQEGKFKTPKQSRTPGSDVLWGGVTNEMIAQNWPKDVLVAAGLDPQKASTWKKSDIERLQTTVREKYPEMYKQYNDKSNQAFGVDWYSLGLTPTEPSKGELPKLPGMSVTTDITTTRPPYSPPIEDKPKFPWMSTLNSLLPYIRPTDQEQLDPNQLMGEMYAMSNNKVEPVQYQSYQPDLNVPYDISLQDIMNENQADYRSAQRMSGYNPAALASLNAQKYGANQKVLGEQFRLNQAMKDKVYGENRNILNNAQLTNLQGLDQQYVRQQEALSNTKATNLAALSSIGAKYAQNKLENRKLGIYENLYKYRFDENGRAQNYNLAQFDTSGAAATASNFGIPTGFEPMYKRNDDGTYEVESFKKKPKDKASRNGSIVKAIKTL